jgi:DNA-binding CsgD family transcriptional regulator
LLTQRETQALQLAANGLRVCEIAKELGVSVRTVEAHLSSAREKLDAVNTTQAAVKGVRAGIIYCFAFVMSINALSLNYPTDMRRTPRPVVRITRTIRRNET